MPYFATRMGEWGRAGGPWTRPQEGLDQRMASGLAGEPDALVMFKGGADRKNS